MLKSTATQVVSTRELAWNTAGTWHGNGENLADGNMTVPDAMALAGLLDWNVRKLDTPVGSLDKVSGQPVTFPGKFGVVRTGDDGEPVGLGVAGSRFEVYQNEEVAEVMQLIADESGMANIVAAGYFGKGEKTFTIMKLNGGMKIAGIDAADWYLGGLNAHDGNASLQLWTTMTRLACVNMLRPSIKSAKSSWRLRHTASLRGRIEKARKSLELTFAWQEEFDAAMLRMLETPMTRPAFAKLVDRIEPPSNSDKAGWVARQQGKRDALMDLFTKADTNGGEARGTRYGAYQAFVEYSNWFQPVKGEDSNGLKRAQRIIDSPVQQAWEQAAFDALYVPA